ncbi:MAG: hypothetical protein DI628_06620 [Blastochloris viridis]|uniref:Uncharacterized protein n=1 Tax=Blastochloris viridis TaxID=1079 RepID=A0A6N4RBG7_BLAVI|nr:MAG: hypothetical protein DI628_06620 [Blastochloris viridis]
MTFSSKILAAAKAAAPYATDVLAERMLIRELAERGLKPLHVLTEARVALRKERAKQERQFVPIGPSSNMSRTWAY